MFQTTEWTVGQRVDSIYGVEHRGTIVEVGAFSSGRTMLHIRRDLDGFVWIGWPGTVLPMGSLN